LVPMWQRKTLKTGQKDPDLIMTEGGERNVNSVRWVPFLYLSLRAW